MAGLCEGGKEPPGSLIASKEGTGVIIARYGRSVCNNGPRGGGELVLSIWQCWCWTRPQPAYLKALRVTLRGIFKAMNSRPAGSASSHVRGV
ncbi:hypothetical protein ANN_13680 [Periplaneta americana]|uniref:Uncharacterized protein n=1 Tax=Periplaneta americana TaxID=6978 RepID=A0ABQ8TL34_PERAM|nr:hypothetical protein ANN_13680 [Periplaneta americana]